MRTLVIILNVVLVWFVLSIPLGMLAGNWLKAVREAMERREREVWDACLYPGGKR